jgi:hypothetical protein
MTEQLRYLGAMAKFRTYSFLNVLLILKTCTNASGVAGHKTWQSFGRQVKQREKGIMTLAPIFHKGDQKTNESDQPEESRGLAGFRAVYVWDVQQTSGKDLPEIGRVTGEPNFHRERLEQFVRSDALNCVTPTRSPQQEEWLRKAESLCYSIRRQLKLSPLYFMSLLTRICTLESVEAIRTSAFVRRRRNQYLTSLHRHRA